MGQGLLKLLFVISVSLQAAATPYVYQAPIDTNLWQTTEVPQGKKHALYCEIAQSLPHFGDAVITQPAGRPINFHVKSTQALPEGYASLYAMPAPWRHDTALTKLSVLPIKSDKGAFFHEGPMVWRMLSELEKGGSPTLIFSDPKRKPDNTELRITSVYFQEAYSDFLACQAKVLPYNFEDVETTTVHFKFSNRGLSADAINKLQKIRDYLLTDEQILRVEIESHTDSKGKRKYNQHLSQKRANEVKAFFTKAGIDADKFELHAHGESRPIASNNNRKGRAQNRRVVIRLIKPADPFELAKTNM